MCDPFWFKQYLDKIGGHYNNIEVGLLQQIGNTYFPILEQLYSLFDHDNPS